ncbi:leucyl/phenylalanyl-tRNA--protein transferase [Neoroseomonas soli]|uniref:Leucyl/phenylalanyl-tRNA--protein transferase n=1 Tax=Neoroseomonas soli TaxID=1081025 RepID=A0A9X9X0W7_9PROT|nr:leucyl/phenylalanyl-tRNA--protein transferase [Neoroseomonas soli]MBR0673046.1 leucyl/phenylalanyl-tRNA--protein transferase [Neoroseomonas soli]
MSRRQIQVTPDLLLRAYAAGVFPMAEGRRSERLYWLDPALRGVLPLDAGFHLPRRLKRTALSGRFEITADRDFIGALRGCAEPAPGRTDTWINDEIERLFTDLYLCGAAHSIEVSQEGRLVGGLYGVALGGAFFGESMFSRVTDASKVALVHLVARLRLCGFVLLDTQFLTEHLARFGAVEIPKAEYKRRLAEALEVPAQWRAAIPPEAIAGEIGRMRAPAQD